MPPRRGLRALLCLNLLLALCAAALFGSRTPREQKVHVAHYAPQGEAAALLHLHWSRQYPQPAPAWPDEPRLQFDASYEPAVLGRTLFVSSAHHDSVTALDLDSGSEKWRFCADGPVRFAPTPWQDRIFFVSDDGYLYCLAAADGRLLWKFRGGPSERKIIGNDRLISTWPARGAPVVADGTVYFAAGIWPFMGVFLHALDARTGAVVWTNSGDGSLFIDQPHHAEAFGGIAPQGTLAVAGDRLLVPNGRAAPACYDRHTGKLLHYRLAENSRLAGGTDIAAAGRFFVSGGNLFDVASGDYLSGIGTPALLTPTAACGFADCKLNFYDLAAMPSKAVDAADRRGRRYSRWSRVDVPQVASLPLLFLDALAWDGGRIYAGSSGQVVALELPLRDGPPNVVWRAAIEGKPLHLTVADGRLLVSTREGRLYCFGPTPAQPRDYPIESSPLPASAEATSRAAEILRCSGVKDGYGVVYGAGSADLIREVARQSDLRIIAIDPDRQRVDVLRRQLAAAGIPAERISLLAADWKTADLPPYLASLVIVPEWPCTTEGEQVKFLHKAFATLRPYGGIACLPTLAENGAARLCEGPGLPSAKLRTTDNWLLLSREGPLPGAADWTHEHADAANTRVSRDQLVKAPLGLLWFGGPSQMGTLPRHGHGPQPQVIDGRAIVEGVDMLRAIDIYTGRLLWETRLAGVGTEYDITYHQAGANGSGGNFASTADGIYVAHHTRLLRLDPATGKLQSEFRVPVPGRPGEALDCNHVTVCGDLLIVAASPLETGTASRDAPVSSKYLAVLDRHTGKSLWTVAARAGFRHNALCAGGGRLYAIDRSNSDFFGYRRHGEDSESTARLVAFDLRTGKELWSSATEVFGTWLSYSARHDVLVEAGRVSRDSLYDEPRGMRAFRAGTGAALWHHADYVGPAMIRGDAILKDKGACDLLTGAPLMRRDPLTGEAVEWAWTRGYGCNTPAASEHLLTFRSGCAGFFDLANDGGTGTLGGFRSGCTNNLVVAGGVLVAPEYTRTCTCGYPNQTSLALVPMPEAELWTYFGKSDVKGVVRRVGINLGAPGSRKADDGTLWLDYPPSAPNPRPTIISVPEIPETFRRHISQIDGEPGASATGAPHKWVVSSGVRGLTELSVTLATEPTAERRYTVRLYFLEPDKIAPGQRRFDVALQGDTVLRDFDVSAAAGAPNRGIVREFKGIRVTRDLTLTLSPTDCGRAGQPVLSGVEIVAEDW